MTSISKYKFALDPSASDTLFSLDAIKWSNHIEDMENLAKIYPNLIFIVSGVGEEYPDIWKKYFKGDNYVEHRAIISYPEPPDWAK